jgi:hypothetical protein
MSQQGPQASACASCGAPDSGEFVFCKFCKSPYNAEAARTAIPCPSCKTACRWGKQKCGACQAWLVVSCVFCGSLSPHNVSNCLQCNEAFAGAPQRKAQMDQQRQHSQQMQDVGVWGNVAAAFAGAAAGSVVSHSWDHHSYSSSSYTDYDNSNVSDDSGGGGFFEGSSDDSGGGFFGGS